MAENDEMNFINLFVEKDYVIRIKNNNIELRGEQTHVYPLSDIGVVMLETMQSTISIYALSKLVESGATVFVCDEKHLPTAQLLPCNSYYRPLNRYKLQISQTKPRQKNLWKEIIYSKISNQADCLEKITGDSGKLPQLLATLRSGDVDNHEAQSASYYFPQLFGKGFTRESENAINGALNYCYAIVRGVISRQICAHGLLPMLGIFHKNEFNAFNLSDDLIEPFRPIVDYYVYQNRHMLSDGLTPNAKKVLFGIINLEVLSGQEKHALSYAIQREVESIIAYYEGKNALLFPKIIENIQHRYE